MSATHRTHLPAYEQVEQLLTASPLLTGAAEAHGVFCGLLAAGAPDPEARWLAELLPPAPGGASIDLTAQDCQQALQAVAAHTRAQLGSAAMNFDLLLPSETGSLHERATSVHDWSRGFLFGAGLAGLDQSRLSGPSQEALGDLLELTRMDLDTLADNAAPADRPDASQADEQALAEIIEFLRVAALMIFEDTAPRQRRTP